MERLLSRVVGNPDRVVVGEVPFVDAAGTTWLELRLTNLIQEPAVKGIVVNVHDVSDRRHIQEDLERRASTDPLTGLPNRAVFLDRLSEVLLRPDPEAVVLYCDLDGFKSVNDRFGHEEGDRLLVVAAVRLAGNLRGGDLVARLGGDEFAVLVHGADARSRAETIADASSTHSGCRWRSQASRCWCRSAWASAGCPNGVTRRGRSSDPPTRRCTAPSAPAGTASCSAARDGDPPARSMCRIESTSRTRWRG